MKNPKIVVTDNRDKWEAWKNKYFMSNIDNLIDKANKMSKWGHKNSTDYTEGYVSPTFTFIVNAE